LHPSSAATRNASYERLEFLGDSVLGFAVVSWLYDRYPDLDEGLLSRVRADVVSRQACAVIARELDLGARLVSDQSAGEELRESTKVLAATLEAVFGALFLEYGIETVRLPIAEAFAVAIERSLEVGPDPKTRLQELAARHGKVPSYTTLAMEGPPHDRTFTAAAIIDAEVVGTGIGRSKKEAEQAAAQQALEAGVFADPA
jgi:ribonuclease-3